MIAILRRRGLGNGSTIGIKKYLEENHGRNIDIVRSDRITETDYKAVLRWGCTSDFRHAPICINTPEMIHSVNDKPECRKKLIENGIKCPTTFFSKEEIKRLIEGGGYTVEQIFPLIGRKRFHAQGRNIVISNSIEELNNDISSEYWSQIVSKDHEYRVYTFMGRILMVAEKMPTEVGRERIAWNHFGGGAVFNNVKWSNWPIEVCKIGLKASETMGIDFAGVDVMSKDGEPYILEINSAHSLSSEYRKKTFAKALNWLCEQIETTEEKPAHFNYPEHIRTYKSMILPILRDE
jgi:glutathione synthase/RimK-type ligase-like ATP-grasp enzyme